MYVIDTNVISELRKVGDGKANRNVVQWFSTIDAGLLYISVITVMDLELGIARVERRDNVQGQLLRTWMKDRVMPEFSERILPITTAIAIRCAQLHVPDPKPERDAYIAATALHHKMNVVTRNSADFATTGVKLINPWNE
ncbi:Toxin FitB [Commensalibacter sp. Nvir]|uniref:type II toxin-antitoxin system VapC family toxin n=1 Tax=Commensalibacter sp. Nvir TaxID=3069817 RepID=UPI002D302D43|nr:Toxin FitB [Commensalibacter sp. Nvir]